MLPVRTAMPLDKVFGFVLAYCSWVRMLILGLRADSTHRMTVVAEEVFPAPPGGAEEEVVRAARAVRVRRTRPVGAVGANIEVVVPAIAGGREENLTATRTCYLHAVDTIDSGPLSAAMFNQLPLLVM